MLKYLFNHQYSNVDLIIFGLFAILSTKIGLWAFAFLFSANLIYDLCRSSFYADKSEQNPMTDKTPERIAPVTDKATAERYAELLDTGDLKAGQPFCAALLRATVAERDQLKAQLIALEKHHG